MERLILILLLLLLSACTPTYYARTAVDSICNLDTLERELLRKKIDEITAPSTIRITCGDE